MRREFPFANMSILKLLSEGRGGPLGSVFAQEILILLSALEL
jgi:hypothetical protein